MVNEATGSRSEPAHPTYSRVGISWASGGDERLREEFTAATPAQLRKLLAYCMDFAQTMLRDSGEFYPFGAVLSPEGEVVAVGGDDGNEHPKPQEVYHLLTRAFVSEAESGKIFGAALAANVNVPEQYESRSRDALRVRLETEGFACLVYVPYEITKSGPLNKTSALVVHEPFSVEVSPAFFAPAGT
jgi:hypothetical protein